MNTPIPTTNVSITASGPPACGKTVILNRLADFLLNCGFRFLDKGRFDGESEHICLTHEGRIEPGHVPPGEPPAPAPSLLENLRWLRDNHHEGSGEFEGRINQVIAQIEGGQE